MGGQLDFRGGPCHPRPLPGHAPELTGHNQGSSELDIFANLFKKKRTRAQICGNCRGVAMYFDFGAVFPFNFNFRAKVTSDSTWS